MIRKMKSITCVRGRLNWIALSYNSYSDKEKIFVKKVLFREHSKSMKKYFAKNTIQIKRGFVIKRIRVLCLSALNPSRLRSLGQRSKPAIFFWSDFFSVLWSDNVILIYPRSSSSSCCSWYFSLRTLMHSDRDQTGALWIFMKESSAG